MKLSKLNKLINLDLKLPMKIKADNTIKVGDVIGVNYGDWECAIVKRINGNNIYGDFYICKNEIDLDKLNKPNSEQHMEIVTLGLLSQKYMVRL